MKTIVPPNLIRLLLVALGLTAWGLTASFGQESHTYYARYANTTSFQQGYYDIRNGGTAYAGSTGKSTQGDQGRVGCFYHTASTLVAGQGFGHQLNDDSAANKVWVIYVTCPLSNDSTDLLMGLGTPTAGATLGAFPNGGPITQTDAFINTKAGNLWAPVCFVTNTTTLHPKIEFTYISGTSLRSYADGIMWVEWLPCATVHVPTILPPYVTNMTSVTVGEVTNATKINVYKQLGSEAPTLVGTLTTGIVDGNNVVPLLSGATLEKNVRLQATQTVGGQESCYGTGGYYVGIGNSSLKFNFNMRALTEYAGPIGAGGGLSTTYAYYFLPGPAGDATGYPQGGVNIPVSPNWQTVTVDPLTVTHGNAWINNGYGTGDPWASGRPAFGAVDSFCFTMADTNSGPYEIFIDNFANGSTLIHDWEDGTPDTFGTGLFTTFANEGSTSPLITGTTPPLAQSTVANSTRNSPTNYVEGGLQAQYVKWQWKSVAANGVWLRKLANAPNEGGTWPSYPQVDLSKPIYFDILVAPYGSTPHALGTLTWMDPVIACSAGALNLSVTAQGPADPANSGQVLSRTFTYQWKRNGSDITGASGSATVGPTDPPATIAYLKNPATSADAGTYSVVVSDGTSSLTRSTIVTIPTAVQIDSQPADAGVQANAGGYAYFSASASIPATCPCANNPNLSYRWLFNGVPMSDSATITGTSGSGVGPVSPNLVINPTYYSNAGNYTLVVTNTCSGQSVTSSVAKLWVTPDAQVNGTCYNGLLGLYFTNQTYLVNPFSNPPAWTNVEYVPISFDWSTNSFNPGTFPLATDYFMVRWVGTLQAPFDPGSGQSYTFYVRSDDGARLWVDGSLVVDSWVLQGATTRSGSIVLKTNAPVEIILEYFEQTGNASVELAYESLSMPSNSIPTSQLCAGDPNTGIPPRITLTSPASSVTNTLGTLVTINATVTQESTVVNSVKFYNNATNLLATVPAPGPYSTTWTPPAVGVYTVSAQVTYSTTNKLSSPASRVTVINIPVAACTISNIIGTTLTYGGGAGSKFVLLESSNVAAALGSWTRSQTNNATPGSFTISTGGAQKFYRIKSE